MVKKIETLVTVVLLTIKYFLLTAPATLAILAIILMYLIFFGPHPQQLIPAGYSVPIFTTYLAIPLYFMYYFYGKEKTLK